MPAATGLLLNEMRRLLTQTNELRGRSRAIREQVAAQLKKAADLIERSAAHQRSLAGRHERYATRTPPFRPPPLVGPVCEGPLHYDPSHIGGVSSHPDEPCD